MTAQKTKAKIRADYELGEFSSILKLSQKWHIPDRTIKRWVEKECWVKAENKNLIQQSIQQQFVEALAAEKCDVVYMAKKVKELMEATNAVVDLAGNPIGGVDKDGRPLAGRKDWTAIAKGIQEANKILGAYAPVKTEVEYKVNVTVTRVMEFVQKYIPANVKDTPDYQNAIVAIFQEVGE